MVNILIKENDVLYRYGLSCILTQAFTDEFSQPPDINFDYTPENIVQADIIILSMQPGEGFHCEPAFHMRTKGITVGLISDIARAPGVSPCINDIIVLPRNIALDRFSQIVYFAWKKERLMEEKRICSSCEECPQRALSGKQHRIMDALYQGKTALEIADELKISDKTVYNHKYAVMRKFNLRTDFELVLFLNRWHDGPARAC